jgi:tetratricopeptide (TPR) repeat protein
MSFLDAFNKKSKLNSMIKQVEQARQSDTDSADGLFKSAYQGYADVLLGDALRADALYHWGFALLHQAKTKADDEAARLYRDALAKFDFCLLLNPSYLGSAINGGVAYMDLARLLGVSADDELYDLAKKQFEKANSIHKGTASYNVACISALRGEHDACLKALEHALNNGSLPEVADILNDADLDSVKSEPWFVAFIESLTESEPSTESTEAVAVTEAVIASQPVETVVEPITMTEDVISDDKTNQAEK